MDQSATLTPAPVAIDPEELPPYQGIDLADVRMVKSSADADAAMAALLAMDVIGFDTESKPTFVKGEVSTGPHLVQLATDSAAFLFQIGERASEAHSTVLKAVLESPAIMKVGFGLSDDIKRLHSKLGIDTANVLELIHTVMHLYRGAHQQARHARRQDGCGSLLWQKAAKVEEDHDHQLGPATPD